MSAQTNWIAVKSIWGKEVTRFLRIWPQTLLPPAITMTLYFVIFGNLIGRQINPIGNFSYIEYIVPGLIMMSVITNSYANVVSSFFSAKFQKHIEELLVAPVPNWVILVGYVGGGVARGLLVGLIVTLVSLFFVPLHLNNIGVIVLVVLLTSLVFALCGFINAIFARKFDDISIIPTFVLTPLTYLGGVFYSIKMLPEFWQNVSLANPILYMVNAFRYGFLGVTDINVWIGTIALLIFAVVLAGVCLMLLNKGTGLKQ